MPEKWKEECLDIYDGIQSEILSTTRFDYYWTQELANHLCPIHTTSTVSHFICYQNLHLKHKEFK